MSDQCIFCEIVRGNIPCAKIFEDDQVLAFLDIGPLSPGHSLLIPKKHYARLENCPADLAATLAARLGPIAQAVITAVNAPGYNILNNNDRCAGQLVEHVHFHIIPRNPDDGIFKHWPATEYPPGEMEKIQQKITDSLTV